MKVPGFSGWLLVVLLVVLAGCSSAGPVGPEAADGPMNGVEVVVGGTPDPTDRLMSALILVALEQRGATVVDRSNTAGSALNRDDLVGGRLDVVPEDIGTGWLIHLGETADFASTTELARELRTLDAANGIRWSDHSSFNDAIAPIADGGAVTDSDDAVITMTVLAERLGNSLDALVCVDAETLQSPDGLVRFERATGYTVPADQLETRATDELIVAVAEGDCTVAFVPRLSPEIASADLVPIVRFADGDAQPVFTPRNAAFMFDAEFYSEWEPWLGPFLETLMVTLDADTMIAMKDQLRADGDPKAIALAHLERNDLL